MKYLLLNKLLYALRVTWMRNILIYIATAFFSAQGQAAVVWSWNFTSPVINTGLTGTVYLEIQLFNDLSSDSAIEFGGAYLNDGSWGNSSATFSNSSGEIIFVANIQPGFGLPQVLYPGQDATFIMAELAPLNLIGGESIFIDPLFHVGDGANGFLSPQYSTGGVQVNVTAIPLPGAAGLLFLSLIALKYITSKGSGFRSWPALSIECITNFRSGYLEQ